MEGSSGIIYDSRDALSTSKKIRSSNNGTGQRTRKKPKKNKAESEEYDSLNSDSDVGSRDIDGTSRTESSNCIDEASNAANFSENFY